MPIQITFTVTAPHWAPTGWGKAIVEHLGDKDGPVTSTRRADMDDWVAATRRMLSAKVWQELSGSVTSVEIRTVEETRAEVPA